jgi:hypothetical protein
MPGTIRPQAASHVTHAARPLRPSRRGSGGRQLCNPAVARRCQRRLPETRRGVRPAVRLNRPATGSRPRSKRSTSMNRALPNRAGYRALARRIFFHEKPACHKPPPSQCPRMYERQLGRPSSLGDPGGVVTARSESLIRISIDPGRSEFANQLQLPTTAGVKGDIHDSVVVTGEFDSVLMQHGDILAL